MMRSLRVIWILTTLVLWAQWPGFAQVLSVQQGETVNLGISYARPFTLEFDGVFKATKGGFGHAKRYVYDGGRNATLDLFEGGRMRLANRSIYFLQAAVGKITQPGSQTDHWANLPRFDGAHRLRIVYDPGATRCQVSLDDRVVGDFSLRISKTPTIGRLQCTGFAGTIRWTNNADFSGGTAVVGGNQPPTSGGLDSVLGGGPGGAAAGDLTAGNSGTRTFTAPTAGTIVVTAKLSTYGAAQLGVTIDRGGERREWLSWQRANGGDRSPLLVNGQPRAGSIFERKAGDFSPRETTVATKLQAGDVVTLSLDGDFGAGTPLLRHRFTAE